MGRNKIRSHRNNNKANKQKYQTKKSDNLALAVAVVELRNHLNRNIFALEERFEAYFNSDFV